MATKRIYQTKYPILITLNIKGKFCLFENQECVEIAAGCLIEAEKIYNFDLLSFVIMPEHIHILLKTDKNNNMSKIMQRYKAYVYHQMRMQLGIKDKFWQRSFDYRIKDTLELFDRAVEYIKNNPSKWELSQKYNKFPHLYVNKLKINNMKSIY